MAVPKNKDELMFEIAHTYTKLKKELEEIPAELTKENELEGHAKGTMMSVADVVAYLIGWGELVLKWHQQKENGEKVDFPETGYKWNELGSLAQKFYKDYDALGFSELLHRLDQTVSKIQRLLKDHSNQELYKTPWYNQWTKGKMIQLNTSSPYKNARSRVRKWKKQYEEKIRMHH